LTLWRATNADFTYLYIEGKTWTTLFRLKLSRRHNKR